MTAVDLFSSMIRLGPDGDVRAGERRMSPDIGGWTVVTLHVENDADAHPESWECHPDGEEVMCVLTGTVRVHFRSETDPRDPDGEPAARLGPGTACVIPRGRWHRITVEEPSDIMAFSRIAGTRMERRTGW
ncbi:cupin [Streptomyces sp. NPDC006925]|uniref:cupin n=1 Tax=Streptomyces sp. NPDC006925 TaxID=3364768 RepID=UPI00369F3CEB